VVPHIRGSFIGVGTAGNQIVTDLCNYFGETMQGISFLNIDTMARSSSETISEITAKGVRFYYHTIGNPSIGGSLYCGLGEKAALADEQMESYLHMSGIRIDDPSQVIFACAATGGGTGSGIAPAVINLSKLCNPEASTVAMAVTPSGNEAEHAQMNAFYAMSKLLAWGPTTNADIILVLNYDKLRHIRGVGRSGKEFKAGEVASYLLWLLQLNLYQSGVVRMCRLSRGAKIQAFVPCVAIGRSMEIFGTLGNVLESAAAYPLAEIDFESVLASYLLLRIPKSIAGKFPDEMVTEEFEAWNGKHIPNVSTSLVQIIHTDERSDRIDVCILLGGNDVGVIMKDAIAGYRRFKTSLTAPEQWDEYGLSEKAIGEAEQVIQAYDTGMEKLRKRNYGET